MKGNNIPFFEAVHIFWENIIIKTLAMLAEKAKVLSQFK